MIRKSKSTKQLTGYFCLPTSSKFHCLDRERSGAFAPDQIAYILTATKSLEEGGYPPAVVLTANIGELELELGDEPNTQHAEVRKNLPPRKVTGVVMPDGTTFGTMPEKGIGLPHWEFIPENGEGGASASAIAAAKVRLDSNRKAREESKEAARAAKKAPKAA